MSDLILDVGRPWPFSYNDLFNIFTIHSIQSTLVRDAAFRTIFLNLNTKRSLSLARGCMFFRVSALNCRLTLPDYLVSCTNCAPSLVLIVKCVPYWRMNLKNSDLRYKSSLDVAAISCWIAALKGVVNGGG